VIEGYQLFEIESLLAQLQPLFVKHKTVIKEVSKIITQNTQHDVQVSRLILTGFFVVGFEGVERERIRGR
jgi:hypothetical protein